MVGWKRHDASAWEIRALPGRPMVEAVKRPSPTSLHVLVARTRDELLEKIRATEASRP